MTRKVPTTAKALRFPHADDESAKPKDTVIAYIATAFFKDAKGDKGYWGALVNDPLRPRQTRIREVYGSCDVSCDYDAAIIATAKVIASVSEAEGVGRALKVYAPTHVVAEMIQWATGRWRPKSKWRGLQESCVAHGPIDFQYPSPFAGSLTGPRLKLAKQLARETAAEWDGVILAERRGGDDDAS